MKGKLWTPTVIVAPKAHLMLGRGRVVSPEGDTLFEDPDWMPNALMDEGEENVLNDWLREQTALSKYLCLIDGGTTAPVETDTLAYLAGSAGARETKVPGNSGYNRVQIAAGDWGAPVLNSGDMQSDAAEKTFGPASGATWSITHVGLVTHATSQSAGGGKFLLFIAISGPTTINIGQSYKYTLKAKVS